MLLSPTSLKWTWSVDCSECSGRIAFKNPSRCSGVVSGCVKADEADLGSASLIVFVVSEDVKQH